MNGGLRAIHHSQELDAGYNASGKRGQAIAGVARNARGRSGLRRVGCWLTARRFRREAETTESGTESKPPD